MKVKAIMIPYMDLKCISIHDTIESALDIIEKHQLLSMPVVNDRKFIGVLSKQHVYEQFFRSFQGTKEEFLKLQVSDFMKTRLTSVSEDTPIEEAAAIFVDSKFRFIPVQNEAEEFVGIVTQKAIFKEYQKLFGEAYNTITIYSYDYKGMLARVCETIARHNGNIKNVVIINTETMGLQEIFIRVECDEFDRLIQSLNKKGFDVRVNHKENRI